MFGPTTTEKPESPPTLAGLDAEQSSSNQEARPVPVIWGTPKSVGSICLTERFDVYNEEKEDKKGGQTRTYYCSFGGLLCQGPIGGLSKIISDKIEVWSGPITRNLTKNKLVRVQVATPGSGYSAQAALSASNGADLLAVIKNGAFTDVIVLDQGSETTVESPPTITVLNAGGGTGATFTPVVDAETYRQIETSMGTIFFYWGSDNADYNPMLLRLSKDTGRNPNGINQRDGQDDNGAEEHPAYVGQCYFTVRDWKLGTNVTQTPNLEFVISRFPVVDFLIDSPNLDSDCNPVAVLAEALTDSRFGLGISAGEFIDTENWDTVANLLRADGIGISPVISTAEEFGALAVKVLEYFAGYVKTSNEGKIQLGLVRDPGCTVGDPNTQYWDETALTDVPELDSVSWEGTFNNVTVTFSNRDLNSKVQSITIPNPANRQIVKEPRSETLQRPWFTRISLADMYARAAAQIEGRPKQTGKITIRESKLGNAKVGDIFKLSWAHWGLVYEFCRISELRWNDPWVGEVEVRFEKDRGYLVGQIVPEPSYEPPETVTHPPVAPFFRVVETPYNAVTKTEPYLAALVAKKEELTDSFDVWITDEAENAEVVLPACKSFCWHGTLDAQMELATSSPFTVTLDGGNTELPSTIQNRDAEQCEWLVLIEDEILSLSDAIPVENTPGQYTLTALRERLDTARAVHAASTEVWITKLTSLRNAGFRTKRSTTAGQTVTLACQTKVLGQTLDPAEWPQSVVTWTDRSKRWWKPRDLTVANVRWYDGPTWTDGQNLIVQWERNNPAGGDGASGWEDNMSDLWFLELRNLADQIVYTLTLPATRNEVGLDSSFLVAYLGGAASFKLRIYADQVRDNQDNKSQNYDEAVVTLVS